MFDFSHIQSCAYTYVKWTNKYFQKRVNVRTKIVIYTNRNNVT